MLSCVVSLSLAASDEVSSSIEARFSIDLEPWTPSSAGGVSAGVGGHQQPPQSWDSDQNMYQFADFIPALMQV